mgnify:CR=1 FL=1
MIVASLVYAGIQNYRLQHNEAYQLGLFYRKNAPKTADFMIDQLNESTSKTDPHFRIMTFGFIPILEHFPPADRNHIERFIDYFIDIPLKEQNKMVDDFLKGAAPHQSYWDMLKPL